MTERIDEIAAILRPYVQQIPGGGEGLLEELLDMAQGERAPAGMAHVVLFRENGKYYTEEDWEIPSEVPDWSRQRGDFTREAIHPADMRHSKDFRRISNGPVLVETQEPWGYPHLFPAPTLQERLTELARDTERRLDDENADRQLLLEGLIARISEIAEAQS